MHCQLPSQAWSLVWAFDHPFFPSLASGSSRLSAPSFLSAHGLPGVWLLAAPPLLALPLLFFLYLRAFHSCHGIWLLSHRHVETAFPKSQWPLMEPGWYVSVLSLSEPFHLPSMKFFLPLWHASVLNPPILRGSSSASSSGFPFSSACFLNVDFPHSLILVLQLVLLFTVLSWFYIPPWFHLIMSLAGFSKSYCLVGFIEITP